MAVHDDFVTRDEEESLLKEAQRVLRKVRYEKDHWDKAIAGYRETEMSGWYDKRNQEVITRTRAFVFSDEDQDPLPHVHLLDLTPDGEIMAHIDAVRFCGVTIAGLSLMSDSVMRVSHDKDPGRLVCGFLLQSRSLYMKGVARREYMHAILGRKQSLIAPTCAYLSDCHYDYTLTETFFLRASAILSRAACAQFPLLHNV